MILVTKGDTVLFFVLSCCKLLSGSQNLLGTFIYILFP
jgi:hypothetical protein